MVEVSLDRFGDKGEDVAGLLSARFDDGQNRLHEAASTSAWRAERELSPDDRVPQATLAGVVGRFHSLDIQQRPEPIAMLVQSVAHPLQTRVAAINSAQQQGFHLLADWLHQPLQSGPGDGPIARARPVAEHVARGAHQVASQSFHLMVRVIDERLEVPLQVGPAPLEVSLLPIHFRPATHHRAVEPLSEQFVKESAALVE
jgi:hypothetical protein